MIKKNKTIIIGEEHRSFLAIEISLFFQNIIETPVALSRITYTLKLSDVSEISQNVYIEVIHSDVAKTCFTSISKFWIKCLKSSLVISEPFLRLLQPFPPTFFCATGFSGLCISSLNIVFDFTHKVMFVLILLNPSREF
ncbi:hypothetical protein RF11_05556 [Thelohanellus kitauei]|uniref:Uncharacterized protein n=1 Tax=Thelohanellus kitauei TaxID=669202 RepID=A0A0C2JR48_THEKT|nr:hypothetical protein RF11_05556 [Thelohanellus kitauei]